MAWVRRLWLHDVRNVTEAVLDLPDGLVVLAGDNGQGKSNVLEALGFIGTLQSFRRAPLDALVRQGAERAIIRAEVEGRRPALVEIEITASGSYLGSFFGERFNHLNAIPVGHIITR